MLYHCTIVLYLKTVNPEESVCSPGEGVRVLVEDAHLPPVVCVFRTDAAPGMGEIAVVVAHLVCHHPVPGLQEQEVAVQPQPLVEIAPVVDAHCRVEPQTVAGVLAVEGAVGLRCGDVD